jgi:hypothetical protein
VSYGRNIAISLLSLYLSVTVLLLLPRLSPNAGGAVGDGGRDEGARYDDGAR